MTSVIVNYAYGGEKILYSKVQTIEPEEVNGQYCFVKVIIKQQGDNIIKEEVKIHLNEDLQLTNLDKVFQIIIEMDA